MTDIGQVLHRTQARYKIKGPWNEFLPLQDIWDDLDVGDVLVLPPGLLLEDLHLAVLQLPARHLQAPQSGE